ncbi:translation initiation factor IF-2-like [Schistocerca piceifrons]|uniref:translation initiation factor IF-2-like n=1 Tax=Schistocerca piceifrons TaxID=274613 RepID=UPI001F5F9301|nr:translation initiation factor IF-2-like [Schistocerca piceifrons]
MKEESGVVARTFGAAPSAPAATLTLPFLQPGQGRQTQRPGRWGEALRPAVARAGRQRRRGPAPAPVWRCSIASAPRLYRRSGADSPHPTAPQPGPGGGHWGRVGPPAGGGVGAAGAVGWGAYCGAHPRDPGFDPRSAAAAAAATATKSSAHLPPAAGTAKTDAQTRQPRRLQCGGGGEGRRGGGGGGGGGSYQPLNRWGGALIKTY